MGLVVEDVHWADSETLDFLTFLGRAGRAGVVRVVVTCRGDEVPLKPQVADWLAQARSAAGAEEITLGPLSRAEGRYTGTYKESIRRQARVSTLRSVTC